jgi:HSP20 family protein
MADTAAKRQKSDESTASQSQSIDRREPNSGALSPYFLPSAADFFAASPVTLMRRMFEDLDRAFTGFRDMQRGGDLEESLAWRPNVEVRQTGDNVIVRAELPGLTDKDVHVEVVDEGLLIQGERRRETRVQDGDIQHSELSYGKFMRLIPLPEGADTDQAKANFTNGVLQVDIPCPKPQIQNRKQIPISTK